MPPTKRGKKTHRDDEEIFSISSGCQQTHPQGTGTTEEADAVVDADRDLRDIPKVYTAPDKL